jgi:hypothetical protein
MANFISVRLGFNYEYINVDKIVRFYSETRYIGGSERTICVIVLDELQSSYKNPLDYGTLKDERQHLENVKIAVVETVEEIVSKMQKAGVNI